MKEVIAVFAKVCKEEGPLISGPSSIPSMLVRSSGAEHQCTLNFFSRSSR